MSEKKSTAIVGYSSDKNWSFTQQIDSSGKFVSPDICSDTWHGSWPGLTTFNIEGGSSQNSAYVFGCGGSDRLIFIQAFTNYGAISTETYREDTGNKYDVCCSYTINGTTYIFMHDTSNYAYAIREVTKNGKLASGFVQNGSWGKAYSSVFAVCAEGNWFLGGHSKSDNKFFLQKILSTGKLDSEESQTQKWGDYYETLIGFQVGARAYIFGQHKKSKKWFTQEVKSTGKLASKEADSGTWGNYYATALGVSVGTETYFIAQSDGDLKCFSQNINSEGKFSSSEADSTRFKYFYSFLGSFEYEAPAPTDNWMTDIYDSVLKDKKLKQIMMPGSHDAGMGECHDCTFKGKPGNTRTQELNILQQLTAGTRYFDLRPIACTSQSGVTYRTGHFADAGLVMGWQGCYGQSMDSICADVKAFCDGANRSKELIILKFSHYLDNNNDHFSSGWSDAQKTAFGVYLQGKLGDVMIRYSGDQRLGTLKYEQLMGMSQSSDKPKVMVVFDRIKQTVRDTPNGIFRYADYPYDKADPDYISPYVDLCVYDEYSNTDKVDVMIAEQKKLMLDPENHGGDMFLLSWTLTLQYEGWWYNAVQDYRTIVNDLNDMALRADQRLAPSLEGWMADSEINEATLPNVLYVDYVSNQQADLCRSMLKQFYRK